MNNKQTKRDKKAFPPIFWVIFAALVIFNLTVFIDYTSPLDRYAKFAKTRHQVNVKSGGVFQLIERNGVELAECRIDQDSILEWQQVNDNTVWYRLVADRQAADNADPGNCRPGDRIRVNLVSDSDPNTLLLLLSVDFADPFGEAVINLPQE